MTEGKSSNNYTKRGFQERLTQGQQYNCFPDLREQGEGITQGTHKTEEMTPTALIELQLFFLIPF